MRYRKRENGFTIAEIIVAIALSAIVLASAIGVYTTLLLQTPAAKERNELSSNLQNALERINDDVRKSSNVSLYNTVADVNAPSTKSGFYSTVPGPDPDTNPQHNWRIGDQRIILSQTPVTSSGEAIYDNAAYGVGAKNIVIYYIRDGNLYRRLIAAPYATNALTTATCGVSVSGVEGGCPSNDTLILEGIKWNDDQDKYDFDLVYYDRNGNIIRKNTGTPESPVYELDLAALPQARAISASVTLESGDVGGGKTVEVDNSMQMQFRGSLNVVPPTVVDPPVIPPTTDIGNPSLIVGAGGLNLNIVGSIAAGDAYVLGRITQSTVTSIGGPVNLYVGNIACGSGASFPQVCSGQPISLDITSSINGTVCARGQTNSFGISGLQPGCIPPEATTPVFNKGNFTSSMTSSQPASAGTCLAGATTWPANTTYNGDVTIGPSCTVNVAGNVYITGGLTSTANGAIRVAESAGRVRPVIVVNQQIRVGTVFNVTPNSYGTTPYFISFKSANNTCSTSPSCSSISPSEQYTTLNSSAHTGTNAAISISNTVTASGASFYAYFGEVNISIMSSVGAAAGQRVIISNTSSVQMNGEL